MGTDISIYHSKGGDVSYLEQRNYSVFGFFADISNLSGSPVVTHYKGWKSELPERFYYVGFNPIHIYVQDLKLLNYEQVFFDKRNLYFTTLNKFLGPYYFSCIAKLQDGYLEMFFT